MDDALVTIVVTPRERFGILERCLATIAANTAIPHHLVCVLGAAPRYAEELAEKACAEHGWELISRPDVLAPNRARNLGLERVATRYVAFVENDVVVAPGWLDALVSCAEETGADVVGPLVLVGEPEDGLVHSLGGTVELVGATGNQEVIEKHLVDNVWLNAERAEFERTQCDYSEFHCMLVRRDVFDRVGPLDEEVLSTAEHLDLALQVKELGGTTWSEPASVVSYLAFSADYSLGDVALFVQRWGDDWCDRSLPRLREKWGIAPDSQYLDDLAFYCRAMRGRAQLPDAGARPRVLDPASRPFAQTNIQLFNQLRADGVPSNELEEVRVAYDAAVSLFSDRLRPSGKPFLAHAVGTASVLAAHGWHAPVVTAGLLHAAYALGSFPHFVTNDAARRRSLRRRVGRLTEDVVHEYARLDSDHIRSYVDADDLDRLPMHVAYAVVVRIANAIEEHTDCGSAYWGSDDLAEQRARDDVAWAPIFAAIAARLGTSEMLELSRELAARVAQIDAPAELRYTGLGNYRVTAAGATEPIAPSTPSTRAPVSPRDPAEFVPPLGPPRLIDRVARVPRRAWTAMEGGRVASRHRARIVECDPRQWAYSACAELGDLRALGPGALRLRLVVESGELGIGVLVPDSWEDFLIPEWNHGPTDGVLEVVLPLPAIQEAGRMVLRSWAPTGVQTNARLIAVDVFRIESPFGGAMAERARGPAAHTAAG